MKKFIKNMEKEHWEFESTPFAIHFRTERDMGYIQRERNFSNTNWSVFFNCKCVHISKELDPAIRKLEKLGVTKQDLFF